MIRRHLGIVLVCSVVRSLLHQHIVTSIFSHVKRRRLVRTSNNGRIMCVIRSRDISVSANTCLRAQVIILPFADSFLHDKTVEFESDALTVPTSSWSGVLRALFF